MRTKPCLTKPQEKALAKIVEEKVIKFSELAPRERQSFEGLLHKGIIDWSVKTKEYWISDMDKVLMYQEPEKEKVDRPAAKYGNVSWDETIDKYLKG